MSLFKNRLKKLLFSTVRPRLWRALQYGVAATIEHKTILLAKGYKTIVDVGANKGQFALAAKEFCPRAKIISFEPLDDAADIFAVHLGNDSDVRLHRCAIGSERKEGELHISAADDSSSLLPITALQETIFPGTEEIATKSVNIWPLSSKLSTAEMTQPSLLKIDVQGFELEVLCGCGELLEHFDSIYVECSFEELYEGQAYASEVIEYLLRRNYKLRGVYNLHYTQSGNALQADFFFEK